LVNHLLDSKLTLQLVSQSNIMKNSTRKSNPSRVQHSFRGVREPILADANTNAVLNLNTDTNGGASCQVCLNSMGMVTPILTSGTYGTPMVVDKVHLKWLASQAEGFAWYRITRARLYFVSNLGSTATGTILLTGFSDVNDVNLLVQTAYINNGKQFDLASGAARDISIQLPIDTSWKKVGAVLATPANVKPYNGLGTQLIQVNSANDICFGAINVNMYGAPASVNAGQLFLDYDVEFKNPVAPSMNF